MAILMALLTFAMLQRVFALVLTAATLGSPLSLALCHVECAEAAANRQQPAHHSCHESREPATLSITAVPHACGHSDDAPAGVERAPQAASALAVVVAVVTWCPLPDGVPIDRVAAVEISPPQTARPLPLRV